MNANEPGQPQPDDIDPQTTRDLPVPAVALAVGAHPDDVEFGCGAALAKWADAGCIVHHVVCTDGSKGTWDATADIAAQDAPARTLFTTSQYFCPISISKLQKSITKFQRKETTVFSGQ